MSNKLAQTTASQRLWYALLLVSAAGVTVMAVPLTAMDGALLGALVTIGVQKILPIHTATNGAVPALCPACGVALAEEGS